MIISKNIQKGFDASVGRVILICLMNCLQEEIENSYKTKIGKSKDSFSWGRLVSPLPPANAALRLVGSSCWRLATITQTVLNLINSKCLRLLAFCNNHSSRSKPHKFKSWFQLAFVFAGE
ncbi:hypothetical protein YC2023_077366 [Brassica napus]